MASQGEQDYYGQEDIELLTAYKHLGPNLLYHEAEMYADRVSDLVSIVDLWGTALAFESGPFYTHGFKVHHDAAAGCIEVACGITQEFIQVFAYSHGAESDSDRDVHRQMIAELDAHWQRLGKIAAADSAAIEEAAERDEHLELWNIRGDFPHWSPEARNALRELTESMYGQLGEDVSQAEFATAVAEPIDGADGQSIKSLLQDGELAWAREAFQRKYGTEG